MTAPSPFNSGPPTGSIKKRVRGKNTLPSLRNSFLLIYDLTPIEAKNYIYALREEIDRLEIELALQSKRMFEA